MDYLSGTVSRFIARATVPADSFAKLLRWRLPSGRPHEVKVDNEVLKADKIFINVVGRALVPPIPGLDQIPYLTNSSMMDMDFLPARLVVLGGSYVGLEFAQA
jgi:pyruvate/2-oxoglutarate dehydrogenase complex dihydrolipoamide dehydrogenase (E3) component